MVEDIFKGDKKIDTSEREDSFGSALKHIGRGLGVLFFKRFYMNLLIIILIIAVSIVITYTLKPEKTAGCPDISCAECEPCVFEGKIKPNYMLKTAEGLIGIEPDEIVKEELTEEVFDEELNKKVNKTIIIEDITFNCDSCPEKTLTQYVYRYICPNGGIVNKSEDCQGLLPLTDPAFTSTANGISISLDGVYYEKENNTVRIKQINYTIINKGVGEILPKVGLKVYEKYTQEVKESAYLRTFKLDDVLVVNEWIKRAENVNINFGADKGTVRLALVDTLPDPDESIVVVYKKIDFS